MGYLRKECSTCHYWKKLGEHCGAIMHGMKCIAGPLTVEPGAAVPLPEGEKPDGQYARNLGIELSRVVTANAVSPEGVIGLRGAIPVELRPLMGDWIFGCDVCQDVCPWNRKSPNGMEAALQPTIGLRVGLEELLGIDETEFRRRFRNTPLWRAGRAGLLRNVAIALGNLGDAHALPALERARTDNEPLVREAAQWAIGRLGG